MKCSCKFIIADGDVGAKFSGPIFISHPTDGVRVELQCTREDDHPANGSNHWWELASEGARLTWSIPEDAVWMA